MVSIFHLFSLLARLLAGFQNLFPFYSLLPLRGGRLKGLFWLSKFEVKRSSLGMSTALEHSVTHSPSCRIKRGCTLTETDLEIPLPPNDRRLLAPSPKPNGPFSEHFPINTVFFHFLGEGGTQQVYGLRCGRG